jgi:hypothetical protein
VLDRGIVGLGFHLRSRYSREMAATSLSPSGFVAPCIPTRAAKSPADPVAKRYMLGIATTYDHLAERQGRREARTAGLASG